MEMGVSYIFMIFVCGVFILIGIMLLKIINMLRILLAMLSPHNPVSLSSPDWPSYSGGSDTLPKLDNESSKTIKESPFR